MTIWIQNFLTAKRIGKIIAPIYDAGFTVPMVDSKTTNNSGTSPTPRGFCLGSLWPMLSYCRFNTSPTIPLLQRFNGAILRPNAATYYISGNQGTLTTDNTNSPQPAYYGGFVGLGYQYSAAKFNTVSQPVPLGIGNTNFPAWNSSTSSDFRGGLGTQIDQAVQIFRSGNIGNAWWFCILDANGALSQAKIFAWAPNGAMTTFVDTNGPYPYGINSLLQTAMCMMPYKPIGTALGPNDPCNVVLCRALDANGWFMMFFDLNLQCLFARFIKLDDPTYDALLKSQFGSPALNYAKVTPQGFLISIGGTSPPTYILLSTDGGAWAPIQVNMVGPNAQAWLAGNGGNITYQMADITIDPSGTLWFAGNPQLSTDPTYIGNTFGFNLQFPALTAMTPTIPPFELSCFTPCDIVVS